MPNKFTTEQNRAASLRGRDMLVAAAAGSGKTAVLTERIFRMITDAENPADIDRLLVVTFTEAAAAEMRQRISAAISAGLAAEASAGSRGAVSQTPESRREAADRPRAQPGPGQSGYYGRLTRQAGLLRVAQISTIHSFCAKILRKYFDRADGLDPDFRIGDQAELELLKSQAIDELFEEEYAVPDNAGFYGLVERYGGGKTKDDMLGVLVVRVYEFLINSPFPERSLADYLSYFSETAKPPWADVIKEELRREFRGALAGADRAIGLCLSPGGPRMYVKALEADKGLIRALMEKLDGSGGLEAVYEAFLNVRYERLFSYNKDADVSERLKEAVKETRDKEIKQKLRNIKNTFFFMSPEAMARDIVKVGPVMEALGGLTLKFMGRYAEMKREKNILDFSDLEHFCVEILLERDAETGELRPSAAAREIAAGFDEILIDEYQDSNSIQELILSAVARPGGRFMVGDVKQSVYKFRRANPWLFVDKYENFAPDFPGESDPPRADGSGTPPSPKEPFDEAAEKSGAGLPGVRIDLSVNFPGESDPPRADGSGTPPSPKEPFCEAAGKSGAGLTGVRIDLSVSSPGENDPPRADGSGTPLLQKEPLGEADVKSGAGLPGVRIDLSVNFRSRAEVIGAVNRVFGRVMAKDLGGIGYDARAALYPGAEYAPSGDMLAEIMLIDAEGAGGEPDADFSLSGGGDFDGEEAENPETELSKAEMEAGMIARCVKDIVDSGLMVTDLRDKRARPAGYGDVAVLLRSAADVTDIFARRFKSLGIPMYADARRGLFESAEVLTALSFLRIVDNPRQDIHLAAVLMSPVYGFTPDELVVLRQIDREADFYQCVLEAGSRERGPAFAGLGEKAGAFLSDLNRWRDLAEYTPVSRLIGRIYEDTGWMSLAGASGGAAGQAALAALAEKAASFEETTYKGLFHFILYIDRLLKSGTDAVPEDAAPPDAVRLMTVHKSKGLEFPVVFVSMLGKKFNRADERESVLLHGELGFGPSWIDLERRTKSDTMARLALSRKIRLENLAEETRVLYVAMTRAREKLILTGCVRNLEAKWKKWEIYAGDGVLPDYYRAGCETFLDWVMPCALDSPEFRVSVKDAGAMAWESAKENADIVRRLDALAEPSARPGSVEELSGLIWRVYPHEADVNLPSKVSISEVKRIFDAMLLGDGAGLEPYRSGSRRETGRSGGRGEPPTGAESAARRGTALHTVMEHVELDMERTQEAVSALIGGLVERNILTAPDAETIPAGQVLGFLNSPLAERMRAAEAVHRETPFVMGLRAGELYPETSSGETLLVHGIIDCWFEEGGKIVLVDYKSDADPENIALRYRGQLEVYARALSKSAGKEVGEGLLYLFRYGRCERVF